MQTNYKNQTRLLGKIIPIVLFCILYELDTMVTNYYWCYHQLLLLLSPISIVVITNYYWCYHQLLLVLSPIIVGVMNNYYWCYQQLYIIAVITN